jgi:hypothetical protein
VIVETPTWRRPVGAALAAPPAVLGPASVDYNVAAHHFDLI